MVVVKSYPEMSDKEGTVYLTPDQLHDYHFTESTELQGEDVVEAVFHRPLSEVIGCRIRKDGVLVTANYRYSDQMKFQGRVNAFKTIHNRYRPVVEVPECKQLLDDTLLGDTVSFDCESGGKSKIRVITFYDGAHSWYVDCRDIKSNTTKIEMLKRIFTSDREWIAHNFAHDCELVCEALKIPFFKVEIDTITLTDEYEFRNLGYLSGVILGVAPYKHELEIANNTKDFKALIKYCAKDSYYTWLLAGRVNVPHNSYVNQFIHTMLVPPELELDHDIYEYYPEFIGMNKKQLRAQLGVVDVEHVQILLKTINKPKPKITLHSLDGFKVSIPDGITYKGDLYMKSPCGATDVLEIMANYPHFNTPEVSAYRYTHKIEPKLWVPDYDIAPEDVFLVNDVVCLTKKPLEGWTKCGFDSIRRLFYGR